MSSELGAKYTCYHCQTKFYDMRKPAPICPKCGKDQREAPAKTAERKRAPVARIAAAEEEEEFLKEADAEEEEEEEVAEEEEDA